MAEYIYWLEISKKDINEIFNNRRVKWNLENSNNLKKDDNIYFFVQSNSAFNSINETISYKGTVTEIFSSGEIGLDIKPILTFATCAVNEGDALTKDKLVQVDSVINDQSMFPIDLNKHSDLKKYIDKRLNAGEYWYYDERRKQNRHCRIKAVPQTHEERIVVDFFNLKKIYQEETYDIVHSNKISGAVSSTIIIKYIQDVLDKNNKDYKVSEPNVYILGCHVEIDALILKKDAESIMGTGIYHPDDVVSILEFKCSGIYSSSKNPFKYFIETCKSYNPWIKSAAYITISEFQPKKEKSIDFYEKTKKFFDDLFNLQNFNFKMFCVMRNYDAQDILFNNDYDWEDFVLSLLPKD